MYCHLSDWSVSTGKKVHKGDLVGFVGKTGNAANKRIQPHLHFEIRRDGEAIDPVVVMQ
jgi:murein DD-endopeptidase MepM/ murein hydrolase activator NlpD